MLICIFSDIHSNLEAFEAALDEISRYKIDKFYCVGDIVGYAANPKECLERVKSITADIIGGNHDWGVARRTDITYFNNYARQSVLWTRQNLDMDSINYLGSLELAKEYGFFTMVHGSLDYPERFNYITDKFYALNSFGLMQKNNLCFIGHTHIPGIFMLYENHIDFIYRSKIYLSDRAKYIINVGSIGQPRDNDPRACYVLYDTEEQSIEFRRVAYDIKSAQEKIINAGLPRMLADRLSAGQ